MGNEHGNTVGFAKVNAMFEFVNSHLCFFTLFFVPHGLTVAPGCVEGLEKHIFLPADFCTLRYYLIHSLIPKDKKALKARLFEKTNLLR